MEGKVLISLRDIRKWNEAASRKFRWDIWKRCFTHRIISHWDRFPRVISLYQACQSPRSTWIMLLGDLILGSPARRRKLDSMILMGPFKLDTF